MNEAILWTANLFFSMAFVLGFIVILYWTLDR